MDSQFPIYFELFNGKTMLLVENTKGWKEYHLKEAKINEEKFETNTLPNRLYLADLLQGDLKQWKPVDREAFEAFLNSTPTL